MKFKDFLHNKIDVNEYIEGINNNSLHILIPKTMSMISQSHVWHLLASSGQKHTALGEFYEKLQEEVDSLAERYIAQGGMLVMIECSIDVDASESNILNKVQEFRNEVSDCASSIYGNQSLASIYDGVVDLQECIDSFIYKFKLS